MKFLLYILFSVYLFADKITIEQQEIEQLSKKYLGNKYLWGGNNPLTGFDCSGYTKYIFGKNGIVLPRTALEQSKVGNTVLDDFQTGDLLFFNTDLTRNLPVTHVGIYLEKGKFIHAANSKKGVIVSSFNSYKKDFVTAKRLLGDSIKGVQKDFFLIGLKKALKSTTKVTVSYGSKYKFINGEYKQVKEY